MNIKTNVQAGTMRTQWPPLKGTNHNETRAQERVRGLTVKPGVQAGNDGIKHNHNETQVQQRPGGLAIKTGVQAGPSGWGGIFWGDGAAGDTYVLHVAG